MLSHGVVAWLKGVVLASVTLLALGGCFLMGKWQPGRPDSEKSISGPPVYVPDCENCHEAPVGEAYAQSRHAAMGIRCGQCHSPEGHPNFTEPVQDSTCGGCHQPAYEQTLESAHFAGRQLRPLDRDQAARVALGHVGRASVLRVSLRRASPRPQSGPASSILRHLSCRVRAALQPSERGRCQPLHALPRARGDDGERTGRQHASVRQARPGAAQIVNAQGDFDADVTRAMSRRQFLSRLLQASSAALLLSSGCTTVRNQRQRRRLGDAEPFTSLEQSVIAKIIDGFNPPDTEFRQLLEEDDPGYDLVEVWSDFAWAHGDAFVANMRTLVNFLDLLPTFTRTFNSRLGFEAHLRFRWFHTDDANRYFIFLRDSNIRTLRNIFTGARFIGTVPIYVNETVIWKAMRYPGPWLLDPSKPHSDLAAGTSFDMAQETDDNMAVLRRRVVPHEALSIALEAAQIVSGPDHLVLETDVVVVGSGAGGSFVAAELAARTKQRVLILDKGEFIEPTGFLQREELMMPRILDTEFSVTEIFRREVPTITAAVVTGKMVGGAATINQALAFEPPRPVIRDWRERYGATFDYSDLDPHLEAIKKLLRIAPVPESQIAGNNSAMRREWAGFRTQLRWRLSGVHGGAYRSVGSRPRIACCCRGRAAAMRRNYYIQCSPS